MKVIHLDKVLENALVVAQAIAQTLRFVSKHKQLEGFIVVLDLTNASL